MIDFWCPYCKHYHTGAAHLVSCELEFIQTAPMKLIVQLLEAAGVVFNPKPVRQLFMSGPYEGVPYFDQLLEHRLDDVMDHFFPPELDDKWSGKADAALQNYADAMEQAASLRVSGRKSVVQCACGAIIPPAQGCLTCQATRGAVQLLADSGIILTRRGGELTYSFTKTPPMPIQTAIEQMESYLLVYRDKLLAALPDATSLG